MEIGDRVEIIDHGTIEAVDHEAGQYWIVSDLFPDGYWHDAKNIRVITEVTPD